MTPPRKALVVALANIVSDPRVRRQADWLAQAGYIVDSLGIGDHPSASIRTHYAMTPQPHWTTTRYGRAGMHAFLPKRARFALLGSGRFPAAVHAAVRSGEYDLIVFSDIELLPWLDDRRAFPRGKSSAHLYLDLHEYFPPTMPPGSRLRIGLEKYYQWTRSYIGDTRFGTRSVVARGIGDLYSEEFGFELPALVRNAPPLADLEPSPVDPDRIELIHHGVANFKRGLRELVETMRFADDRFRLTFMLQGAQWVIDELRELSADLGDRVRFVDPVPMPELPREINPYDLEVMFFKPITTNLRFALPNKFFEAVQGRLGVVIGDSPMMVEIVNEIHNGAICDSWEPEDLARTLNALSAEDIRGLKQASHVAAAQLNGENERRVFIDSLGTA